MRSLKSCLVHQEDDINWTVSIRPLLRKLYMLSECMQQGLISCMKRRYHQVLNRYSIKTSPDCVLLLRAKWCRMMALIVFELEALWLDVAHASDPVT